LSGDIALDFGSAVTRVADARGVMLLEEPTVAAVDSDAQRLLAFGTRAIGLGMATAGRVSLVRPVRHGQLVDIALAEDVLVEVVRAAGVSRLAHPRVLACVHAGATRIQQRALDRALRRAGARQVRFIEQPVACAVGSGLPIEEPSGSMVVDVGAGTTDIAVLALGALVTSASLPIGGDDFDEAVRLLLARRYDVVVDASTASEVRKHIGSVRSTPELTRVEVRGRERSSGLPDSVVISAAELHDSFEDLIQPVLDAAVKCIATAPPDLANDLLSSGLHLSGGGSLLDGLSQRLAGATGLPVHAAVDPGRSSVLGAARCLEMYNALGPALSAAPRR
jgi:rod shape-determining protein MreB